MRRKTKRIYYGPPGNELANYWTVKIRRARQPVTINGTVAQALRSHPRVTVGCGLSNMAFENARQFPHKVFMAVFTKSTALLVDRLKANGEPYSAVLYEHRYKHITEMNDAGTLRQMVREDPTIMEREFTLLVPRPPQPSGPRPVNERRGHGDRGRAFVPRGALARAVHQRRIHPAVAQQLTDLSRRAND